MVFRSELLSETRRSPLCQVQRAPPEEVQCENRRKWIAAQVGTTL